MGCSWPARAATIDRFALANPHPEASACTRCSARSGTRATPARVRLAVDRRDRRLRAEDEPDPARLRHHQGHVLRADLRHPARRPGRALHLAVRAPLDPRPHQADDRDHGGAAERRDRLCRRALSGVGRRAEPRRRDADGRLLPIFGTSGFLVWNVLPRGLRRRLKAGAELLLILPLLLVGGWVALAIAPSVEAALFGGDRGSGCRPRSASPTISATAWWSGLAMGFAVIPIIFTICEDAFGERAVEPVGGLAGARRQPLADGDPRRAADGEPRHLLGGDGRLRPRRWRDDDRADGDRQYADAGLVDVQRLPHDVGEHRGRDSRGAARRHALPHPVPLRGDALS